MPWAPESYSFGAAVPPLRSTCCSCCLTGGPWWVVGCLPWNQHPCTIFLVSLASVQEFHTLKMYCCIEIQIRIMIMGFASGCVIVLTQTLECRKRIESFCCLSRSASKIRITSSIPTKSHRCSQALCFRAGSSLSSHDAWTESDESDGGWHPQNSLNLDLHDLSLSLHSPPSASARGCWSLFGCWGPIEQNH